MTNSAIVQSDKKMELLNRSAWKTKLFLVGLVFLFFSRILVAIGFPSLIDFFHYFYFAVIFFYNFFIDALEKKLSGIQKFIVGLWLFLICTTILNQVGLINAIISCLTISQPFILIYFCKGIHRAELEKFLNFVFLANAIFAYVEYFILGYRVDNVKGIFLNMGAGHHICGAVAIIAMIYYFCKFRKTLFKVFPILFQFFVVFFCDNKQSLFVFVCAFIVMALFGRVRFKKKLALIFAGIVLCIGIYILGRASFPAILTYLNFDRLYYGLEAKFSVFSYLSQKTNLFSDLFGFGAGMTVSRTAQNLVNYKFLQNFGATISDLQNAIWQLQESNWRTNSITGSSMFSLYFSYAGFYGDFGLVGLLLILFGYIKYIIKGTKSFANQLLIIYFLLHGLIFQWLEEPQFVAAVILCREILNYIYQKQQIERKQKYAVSYQ